MIERFHKSPHQATPEDVKWFWRDMDREDSSNYTFSKCALENWKFFLKLNDQYPFELTEWLMEWYSYMPDAIYAKLDGAGGIDWNLFFTLIYPLNIEDLAFICTVKALNVKQNQLVRDQIFDTITKDPDLSKRVLNNEAIPSIYTSYTTYKRIRTEVIKRTKKIAKSMQCLFSTLF